MMFWSGRTALVFLWTFAYYANCGILRVGNPLSWQIARPILQSVRASGLKQFINHYLRSKDLETPLFLWGDELEVGLLKYDETSRRFDLSMRGKDVKEELDEKEQHLKGLSSGCEWQVSKGVHFVLSLSVD